MSVPLVSIVIATYRSRHDHLRVAIASALAQSMADIEVLVSDDSPDDALSELVAGFHDERLRYRHNAPALGVARNHWESFGEARGEFVEDEVDGDGSHSFHSSASNTRRQQPPRRHVPIPVP